MPEAAEGRLGISAIAPQADFAKPTSVQPFYVQLKWPQVTLLAKHRPKAVGNPALQPGSAMDDHNEDDRGRIL